MTPARCRPRPQTLDPEALTWVVVGDLSKIEKPVRALKLGEVQVLDADGKRDRRQALIHRRCAP